MAAILLSIGAGYPVGALGMRVEFIESELALGDDSLHEPYGEAQSKSENVDEGDKGVPFYTPIGDFEIIPDHVGGLFV